MQPLGDLVDELSESFAYGISGNGSIIVGNWYSSTTNTSGTFIWDAANGMRDLRYVLVSDYGLNLTGWHLSHANAISSDGRAIVGTGTNPLGQTEAWIATIPEPSSLAILGLCGIFLFLTRSCASTRPPGRTNR
jgi:uncharacterized membrane protein